MSPVLRSVLVANRGEIARRVFRTARSLGLSTVAVYSDADAAAPFVAEADLAVRLPGSSPAETYLRADLVVAAAVAAGADCVHPGYGFLSENADFARAVEKAGLVFVGPTPSVIEAMGDKLAAKELMAAAGVPVLPSETVRSEDLAAAGDRVGYPLLVKASRGGGGRGMRPVFAAAELAEAVASASREAASAFGDGTVFLERLVAAPRHVEVQIFGDTHGHQVALPERECSIQRRHQKVIEESPSPAVSPPLRAALAEAALLVAGALDYTGAGTVEFLLAPSGEFYFLEVNTRLQVEHPVTEAVTGLDLVAAQFAVAAGSPLPAALLAAPAAVGHAVEARLYAEDATAGWLPQAGVLRSFSVAADVAFAVGAGESGVRLDSGVVGGDSVGVFYDPMLAKVIAWAPDRATACRLLAGALARASIHGVVTNRDLLVHVLRHRAFLAGETDTGFLERHGVAALGAPLTSDVPGAGALHAVAAALGEQALRRSSAGVLGGLPSGWRNNPTQPQRVTYDGLEVTYRFDRAGLTAAVDGVDLPLRPLSVVVDAPDGGGRVALAVEVALGGSPVRVPLRVLAVAGAVYVDSPFGASAFTPDPRFPDPTAAVAPGSLTAPMPGTVVRVDVAEGDPVTAGQTIMILEAMKMEHHVVAPTAGRVASLPVATGAQVDSGAVLAVLTDDGGDHAGG